MCLKIGKEKTFTLVDGDVPRTFSQLKIFTSEGPFYRSLIEVLEIYSLYRLELGYIQGMSYIAGMICLFSTDTFTSFVNFNNIIIKYHFFDFFSFNMVVINKYYDIFTDIFKENANESWKILNSLDIPPERYIFIWFQSVFLKVLPLKISCRIWDYFLYEGILILFKTSVTLMKLFTPLFLLIYNKEDAYDIISKVLVGNKEFTHYWDSYIKEEQLFKGLHTVKIQARLYHTIKSLSK